MKQKMQESSLKRARESYALVMGGMSVTDALKKTGSSLGSYYTAKKLGKLNGSAKPEKTMVEKTIEKAAEMINAPMPATKANNRIETLAKMILTSAMPDSEKVVLIKFLLS